MRERSSPGIRALDSLRSASEANFLQNHAYKNKDPRFDDIYQSVEKIGGIGSSRSNLNLSKSRERNSELENIKIVTDTD